MPSLFLFTYSHMLAVFIPGSIVDRICYIILAIATLISMGLYYRDRMQHAANLSRTIEEYQIRALNARISPHFLQNVFNFLAHEYDKADKDTRIQTIKSLADLLRQLITNIEKRLIPLEEELEFTEHYLQLKKMIFSRKFEYSIRTEDDLDTFGIDVPAILLQPIVENSIKHGFRNMHTGGLIEISLRQQGGHLLIEIRDNGQDDAALDEDAVRKKGESWLDMTRKRMEISYAKHHYKPKVLVKNLEPSGQLTELYIPLL